MSKTNRNPDVIEIGEAKSGCASVNGYAPSPEAMAFVRKKIAHQMARRTWSNQWSEDHIYDAARMLDDWMAHNEKLTQDARP